MITEQNIDHIYDALSTMALASEMLARGNVDNKDASDMAWLLGGERRRWPVYAIQWKDTALSQRRFGRVGK